MRLAAPTDDQGYSRPEYYKPRTWWIQGRGWLTETCLDGMHSQCRGYQCRFGHQHDCHCLCHNYGWRR